MNRKILVFIMLLVSISSASADGFSLQSRFIRFIKFNGPLVGVDLNKNGVRDDVEKDIIKKFPNQNRRSLALLWAHHYETILRRGDDKSFDRSWWMNNEKLTGCAMAMEHYGLGVSISDSYDDRYWIHNIVYNRSNRWDEYINWYNDTFYLASESQEGSDHFNFVVMMKDLCSFKIINGDEIQRSAMTEIMKSYPEKKRKRRRFNSFEKQIGTKYRNVYEKYLK